MLSRATASPDDIRMSSVFDALKRSALWLILASLALGGLTFGVLCLVAPRYESEAELAIVAKGASSTFADPRNASSGPDLVTTRMDKEAINTHVKAMQSPELLEKVAAELKLMQQPEFNSALGPVDTLDRLSRLVGLGGPKRGESDRDRLLAAFRSRLEVYAAKESRFIGVSMTSIDPVLAAKIANAIAENYRASLAEQGVDDVDDLQKVLQSKIAKLTPEVAAAETEAERYRGQIDGFRGGAQNTGLNDQQMSELTAELTRAKAARGEAEARADAARQMMKAGTADQLADVQKSPLIQNLVQQRVRIERQISELSATLLPAHPRMRQLQADLAGLKVQLNGEMAKIVDSLQKEANVAKGREDSITQSLTDIKARVVTNAPREAQLRQLVASAQAKSGELDNLQSQLESNRKRLDLRAQPVEAEIIAKAQPESVPVFPRKTQLSALITVASLMFGAAWIVTRALFREARGSVRAVSRPMPKPTSLRVEPMLPAQREPLLREIIDSDAEGPSAAPSPPRQPVYIGSGDISALVARIEDRRPVQGGHRTLLTGEVENIDPSREALELARGIADTGAQVILVDWSMDGIGMADAFGIDASVGLNDLIRGDASFEEIIQRIAGSNAHAIAGGKSLNSEGTIDADQLNLVLDALDEAYDYIVVAGRHDEARKLFEKIEGRFDAGIAVVESSRQSRVLEDPLGTFLGFEVADIDIIRFERRAEEAAAMNPRMARVTQAKSTQIARQA
jgi:uncharacterized protein involved in exopolysaccharide biosynthesis/Mrp family chromosome partitioning ATPase